MRQKIKLLIWIIFLVVYLNDSMFKIIILYELFFILFWNIIYYGTDLKSFVQSDILTSIFIFFSTMALGWALVSTVRYTFSKIPDPRKPRNLK